MEKASKAARTAARQIEDLPVSAEEATDVKGGIIVVCKTGSAQLPAVQNLIVPDGPELTLGSVPDGPERS